MDSLYIVIPAYNEEENIKNVINDWYPIVEKIGGRSKLLIIDDGSKDKTYQIMLEESKDRPHFQPLTKTNGGHGATLLFGYYHAIEDGADYIFQTDSDGQTVPEEFWQFWKVRKEFHMIIGNRTIREDGFSRVMVTKVLKLVLAMCFRVNIKDANTPFRLMDCCTLKKYIEFIPKDYNLSNVMISVIYSKLSLDIKFYPITFRPRQGGVNSINMKKIVKIGKQAIIDFNKINKCLKEDLVTKKPIA